LNLYFEYSGSGDTYNLIALKFQEVAVNYDAYVLNPDRDENNPNILFSRSDNKHYLIDFGNAFDHLFVINDLYSSDAMLRISSWYDKYIFDTFYLFADVVDSVSKYLKMKSITLMC